MNVRAYNSAVPGSMFEKPDGQYIERDDAKNLVSALAELLENLTNERNDFEEGCDDARKEIHAMREAAMALYSLHEPEGRFQPSHYKPILANFRRAFGIVTLAGKIVNTEYKRTAANVELASEVLEWLNGSAAKGMPEELIAQLSNTPFALTARRIAGDLQTVV